MTSMRPYSNRWVLPLAVTGVGCALLFAATQAFAGMPAPSGLCPPGLEEIRNAGLSFDDVGCSICRPEACQAECLTVPVKLCPPGPSPENRACCQANPCNGNCPDLDLPLCSFLNCQCEPEGCCTVVCPAPARAPVAGTLGLFALALALGAIGMLFGRRRLRLRRH